LRCAIDLDGTAVLLTGIRQRSIEAVEFAAAVRRISGQPWIVGSSANPGFFIISLENKRLAPVRGG